MVRLVLGKVDAAQLTCHPPLDKKLMLKLRNVEIRQSVLHVVLTRNQLQSTKRINWLSSSNVGWADLMPAASGKAMGDTNQDLIWTAEHEF